MSVCLSVVSVCPSVCPPSRMFDFCFVCHHFAAAWASSLAHSLRGKRSFSCSVPPRLPDCLSLFHCVCPSVTLSVCLSVVMSRRSRRLADTVGSNCEPAAALGSFSCKPGPGRDCYGRDGPVATGQAAATTIAQLIRRTHLPSPPHNR